MDDALAQVQAAYDSDPEAEWDRLDSGADWRLEYLITIHALRRHLPPLDRPRRILDAGGGPGRFTLRLAEWGQRDVLLATCDHPTVVGASRRGTCSRSRVAPAEPLHRGRRDPHVGSKVHFGDTAGAYARTGVPLVDVVFQCGVDSPYARSRASFVIV